MTLPTATFQATHLTAEPTLSPFSLQGIGHSLDGAVVHYAYSTDDFTSTGSAHQAGVGRFLSLYIQGLGGTLVSFSPDIAGVLRAAQREGVQPVIEATSNPTDDKPVMHRIMLHRAETTPQPLAPADSAGDPIGLVLRDLSDQERHEPPPASPRVENLIIGAKWKGNCDIDLYSAPNSKIPELFFARTRTAAGAPNGIFSKDYRETPPGVQGFETIAWKSPLDLRTVTCWLNLYAGDAPKGVDIEIRAIVDGRPYERVYHLTATSGNRGANHAERANDPHWVQVNLAEICRVMQNPP